LSIGFRSTSLLSQAVLPAGVTRVYGYDGDSNRTSITDNGVTAATYAYNPSATPGVDELTSVTTGATTTYAYTADGQIKSAGPNTISWDGWQRISSGTFGGITVTYHYDPSGGLKSRTSSAGSSTRYLLGDLFETNGAGAITTAYVDGPVGDLGEYAGTPTLGSMFTYLYYNGHGDLAAEADGTGTRSALHTYDPFGAPVDAQPADQTAHRYTGRWGKQYDTASGLILMGARPYDPTIGRFLAVDPIEGGSLNNYDYAGQDPINGFDLTGQSSIPPPPGPGWVVRFVAALMKYVTGDPTQIKPDQILTPPTKVGQPSNAPRKSGGTTKVRIDGQVQDVPSGSKPTSPGGDAEPATGAGESEPLPIVPSGEGGSGARNMLE